jgi:hypothetical protein
MRQRVIRSAALPTCVVLASAVLAGCGARTSVSGEWEGPRTASLPRQHLLVVGVSPNSRIRRGFEQEVVRLVATGATRATPSIQAGSPTAPLDALAVGEMVRATGADTVLVTRLVSRRVGQTEAPGRVGVKTQMPGNINDAPGLVQLFSTDYQEYEEPAEITTRSVATVETSVFEASGTGSLFYRISTTVEFDEERDDVVAEVAGAIARQLKRAGLVR